MLVKTYFSKTRSINNHIIDIPNDAKSYSAAILLHNKLIKQDEDRYWKTSIVKWYNFRQAFLKDVLKKFNQLSCAYCPRTDLVIGKTDENPNINNNSLPNLATIDHIYPLSLGGAKYDVNNCTVACRRCNGTKGSTVII